MNTASVTRAFARNASESAYPNLWRGLVAAWLPPGAPKHPTRLIDYSGNGNHGTLQNGTSWDIGKNGRCMNFDGVDDDVIGDTPGKNFPSGGEPRSVACWIKSSGWSGDRGLLHWGQDGGSPAAANYQLVAASGGVIHWGNGYDGITIFKGTTVISDGKWHHVAGVYGNGNAYIYIDAKLDASGSHTAATILTTQWRWGRFQNSLGQWPGSFQGCLVYRRALNAGEVLMLAKNTNPLLLSSKKTLQRKINRGVFISMSC